MKKIILFTVLVFGLLSCVKNNPDPAWLEIKEWTLNANPNIVPDEGELTHNFTNAWIFADGKFIGAFELPIKLPILEEGTTELQIYPTILNNGISATKKIYPFVEPYIISVDFVKNQTITIQPQTKYKDNAKVTIIDDFEGFTTTFIMDPTTLAELTKENDPQYLKWGNGYGQIVLTSEDSLFAAVTKENYVWPKGQEIYLEIDYRNSNDLITGILEVGPQSVTNHPNIQMNGQQIGCEVWKKIYIDLREIVSGTPNAQNYELTLQAALEAGGVSRSIMIDNIKVVHY